MPDEPYLIKAARCAPRVGAQRSASAWQARPSAAPTRSCAQPDLQRVNYAYAHKGAADDCVRDEIGTAPRLRI